MAKKNFFSEFINNLFSLQERYLEGKYQKKLNALNYSKDSMLKSHMVSGASLTLSSELEKSKQKIKDDVKKIAKENLDKLENLLSYAENKGTKFYRIKNARKFLKLIKEEEGLILPKKGISALYLNFLTSKKISLKTDSLFIFEDENLSAYNILYNFYKWYAYQFKLPGFEEESLSKIKNLDELEKEENLENLTYSDIMSIKQAIARDKEAMEFVLSFMKEIEGSKNAYNNLKNKDNGASL